MLLLTYDLIQNGDSQLNNAIKEYLKEKGWSDTVSYWNKTRQCSIEDTAPSTTLWKNSNNPEIGCNDFEMACLAYNTQNLQYRRMAKGKVVCVNFNNDDCSCVELA